VAGGAAAGGAAAMGLAGRGIRGGHRIFRDISQ